MKRILIIGATSAIAEATARLYATRSDALFLVARDAARLIQIADDLRVRGAVRVDTAELDVSDFDRHAAVLEQAERSLGGFDTVLIAHGTLSDTAACDHDVAALRREFDVNALSVLSLANLIAPRLQAQRGGTLAVISSVAGDRGRASNYVYGSAKAAVTTYLSGLRQRLHSHGVNVLTIKPGFVDTPMTREFRKGALWASPDRVARGIVGAIDRGAKVVYLPFFWRPILALVRAVPEWLFVRLGGR